MKSQAVTTLLNMCLNVPMQQHQMEHRYLCRWFTKRDWKRMGTTPPCFMDTVPTATAWTPASTPTASAFWTVGLSLPSDTFAAAPKWDAPGTKTARCYTKEIHSQTLLPAQNTS